jgi:mannose-6-phosphate isomerase-like protein (cupin superfamily)
MEPDVLQLTPYESVRLLSRAEGCLEVEATYLGGRGRPPRHWHPTQDEHFEVLAGTVHVELDREKRELGAGESVEIPRGGVHRMWNEDSAPARVAWRTSPAGRTEQWFRAIDALHRDGMVSAGGMPGPLAFGVLLSEYRDVLRIAGPDVLLRPAFAALGVLGRARGYSAFDARTEASAR